MNKFSRIFTVRSLEMDSNYLLKKIEVARYFQECFALYCTENKVAAFDIIKEGLIWVLSQMHIEFTSKMPRWSEDVKVEVWFSEIERLKIYVDFQITHQNIVVAKGDSLWFILDEKRRRPVNPSETLKDIPICSDFIFGEHSKFTIEDGGEKICSKDYKVSVFDLDFNHHMNNISYALYALHTVSPDFLSDIKVKSYKIKFLKECFLDDEITSEFFKKGDVYYFILTRKNDNATVCELEVNLDNVK